MGKLFHAYARSDTSATPVPPTADLVSPSGVPPMLQGGTLTTTEAPSEGHLAQYITGVSALIFWFIILGCVVYFCKSCVLRCTQWAEKKLCCGGTCSDATCCAICCFGSDLEDAQGMITLDNEHADDPWSTGMDPPPPYELARTMPRPAEVAERDTRRVRGVSESVSELSEPGYDEHADDGARSVLNLGHVNPTFDGDDRSTDTQTSETLSSYANESAAPDSAEEEDEGGSVAEEEAEDGEDIDAIMATLQEQLRSSDLLHTITEEPYASGVSHDFSYPPSPMRMSRAPSLISLGRGDFTYPNTPYPSFPPTPNVLSRAPSLNDLPDTVSFRSIDSQLPTYRSAVNILLRENSATDESPS